MSACVPTRPEHTSRTTRASRFNRPHSPPSGDGDVDNSGDSGSANGGKPHRARFKIAGGDLAASITVFLIAVPMSLGLAVAIDAPLAAGLIGAAVGGIVAGLLGGSPLLVSGPSAGLTVVTAELIHRYGWRTTCGIVICAGFVQILLGSLRAARSALAVSPAIVHGTLAGIGVAIALAQLHIVLGGSPESSATANALALPEQLANLGPAAPLIGGLTIAVLILWPRLPGRTGRTLRKIPAALASVAIATAVAAAAAPSIARVDLPSWSTHALPQMPEGPVLGLIAAVLTVTLVASLESLLSAVAVDKLAAERPQGRVPRSDLDRELRGQGISNMLSGLLGGLPISGGAVRSTANVRTGAVSRASTVLHGVWVLGACALLVGVLEWIPLAALAALVMMVGIQMVSFAHIRNVHRHREFLVYVTTVAGVVVLGVLEGVALGIAVAVAVAMHRLAKTRIVTETTPDGVHHVRARGQLTFLAVPRLTRTLGQIPQGTHTVVELDGSFMDHAAYETLQTWQDGHVAQGGKVEVTGRSGIRLAGPVTSAAHTCCRPWTPWRNHHCDEHAPRVEQSAASPSEAAVRPTGTRQLASGLSAFQRNTAPLVRDELARLAREGQSPSQLFLTCADSRLVTSMITSSGPGDLFTVRNVGNLVPPAGSESGDDSVAAAIEYAVDVLKVESITICGHSGCGAMQALLNGPAEDVASTPLRRWLRHGAPSLKRMRSRHHSWARISGRLPTDVVEQLCLTNVVQQLEHLRQHESVKRRLAEGTLELHGMYFHVAEAQAYLLVDGARVGETIEVFDRVTPSAHSELEDLSA
ncbi:bifunctional SulP family inorganic anion transporter/carbonic anhydrase [Streptomyces sp. NBC_00237]|uniref:bifunctional SulP family inorganic anion transporter/carbonic anhydrase n=1 Tax=Streptomyces sp. NBC_00237 TaxID=2975687 RepID=UPI00224FFE12|nr:bifunctional SulP family inorganic anion transporter/carbonic anhydrase [Streptomyces sp. NBC_00237]MCX5207331.1 bifunctional SulP family inorganic anion transporter/carbonic anhydrase [Streptomyces sp. NBC_00237]